MVGRKRTGNRQNTSVQEHRLLDGNKCSKINGLTLGAGVMGNRAVRTGLLER